MCPKQSTEPIFTENYKINRNLPLRNISLLTLHIYPAFQNWAHSFYLRFRNLIASPVEDGSIVVDVLNFVAKIL